MSLLILLLIFLLKRLNQPYLVAYILAGVLLGPHMAGVFTDNSTISSLGEIGILLLMFFLGMEMELADQKSLLLQPLIAQGMKIIFSLLMVFALGGWLHWSQGQVILLAAVLIFNSTAVVSTFLKKNRELHTDAGQLTLNILLLQDVLLAPVLTLFQFLGNRHVSVIRLVSSAVCCVLLFLLLRAIRNRNLYQWPLWRDIGRDHELQVFTGALICFGFALLADKAGLSGPVGSFAAGIYIGRTHAFRWLEKALRPFQVFFTALFFVSIGLTLDLPYLKANCWLIGSATLLLLLSNSLLSSLVFRLLKLPWKSSLYAGALLSLPGEFGILACSLAYRLGMIDAGFFKAGIAVTALSLLCATLWLTLLRRLIYAGKLMFS
ncbi:cation:proton antiporter [Mucilaginibacter sp.]|uniref:cation:proton antiporter n=1 Tax=Mucilaginibacter sp. TaxID=1882438 RepID=UPI00260E934B|nr:cation:proton antiporter [Mucilaginibacter sp.]